MARLSGDCRFGQKWDLRSPLAGAAGALRSREPAPPGVGARPVEKRTPLAMANRLAISCRWASFAIAQCAVARTLRVAGPVSTGPELWRDRFDQALLFGVDRN